jgi:hypothetical protein
VGLHSNGRLQAFLNLTSLRSLNLIPVATVCPFMRQCPIRSVYGLYLKGVQALGKVSFSPGLVASVVGRQNPGGLDPMLIKLFCPIVNFIKKIPSSLMTRPNKLEGLSLETLSSQVLEFEGKARANPIGLPFRCFVLG